MDTNKKVQLEEAGWTVGSTRDFIGLSDEETANVELKLKLPQLADRTELQPICPRSAARIQPVEHPDAASE